MNIEESLENKLNFSIQILLVGSIFLSIIYSWSFWSSFGLNIFVYLNFWDIIKISFTAFPCLVFFLALVIGIATIFSYVTPKKIEKYERIALLISITMALGSYFLWNTYLLTFSTLIIVSIPIIFNIIKKKNNDDIKTILILIFLILPFLAFMKGETDAKNVLNYGNYLYTYTDKDYYKFLGYINRNYFFISMDNKNLLIKDNIKTIKLKSFHGDQFINEPPEYWSWKHLK